MVYYLSSGMGRLEKQTRRDEKKERKD